MILIESNSSTKKEEDENSLIQLEVEQELERLRNYQTQDESQIKQGGLSIPILNLN